MYRHRSKRNQWIRAIIVYSVMTTAVAVGLTIGVMYMLGYRLDTKTQSIEQGGLLRFETRPSGARVFVDDVRVSGQTSNRLNASAGQHNVVMQREGYHDWQKTISLSPGTIQWLNYALLVPEQLKVSSVQTFSGVDQSLPARESNKVLFTVDKSKPEFRLAELSDRARITNLSLQGLVSAKAAPSTYHLDSWDEEERRVLVEARSGQESSWYVLDTRDPARSVSLDSIETSAAISKVMFSYQNPQVLYAKVGDQLVSIDTAAKKVTKIIAGRVQDFWQSHDGVVTYLATQKSQPDQVSVNYYTYGASNPRLLKNIKKPTSQVQAVIGEYAHRQYLVILSNFRLTVERLSLHASDSDRELELTPVASRKITDSSLGRLSFSPHDRFATLEGKKSFLVYDIELNNFSSTNVIDSDAGQLDLDWLDKYYVWSASGGIGRIYEFDGANSHELIKNAVDLSPKLTKDSRYLYAWRQAKNGVELVRVDMIAR